jgi:hypothetical protein
MPSTAPWPCALTILLATKLATRPSISHPIIDILSVRPDPLALRGELVDVPLCLCRLRRLLRLARHTRQYWPQGKYLQQANRSWPPYRIRLTARPISASSACRRFQAGRLTLGVIFLRNILRLCTFQARSRARNAHAWRADLRSMPTLDRYLITFCIGAAATLAWQSYGDAALAVLNRGHLV